MHPALNNPIGSYTIVLGIDKAYARPALTLIESILSYAKEAENYAFFILHTNLPEITQTIMEEYASDLNTSLYFIKLDKEKIQGPSARHISSATYYRLLIPRIFKEWQRLLYLDGDMLALSNITPIFDTVEAGKALGAARDSFSYALDPNHAPTIMEERPARDYFQAGMIVFNPPNISDTDVENSLKKIGLYNVFFDQDILNNIYAGQRVSYIPQKFHFVIINGSPHWSRPMREECIKEREKISRPVIIHYAGEIKPWHLGAKQNPRYHFYDDYQRIQAVMNKKLEKIFLTTISKYFP